jgi:hypothetical protein
MRRRKILLVCVLDRIHTSRWLSQFENQNIDFLIFPSSPSKRIRPELKTLLRVKSQVNF